MKKTFFIAALLIFLTVGLFAAVAMSAEAPRMTKEELRAMVGKPGVVVMDVRAQKDWEKSDLKIAGAVREDPGAIESWAKNYPKDKTLVFYCA